DIARGAGCRVAIFATDSDVTRRDKRVARAIALVEGDRIILEKRGTTSELGVIRDDAPVAAQVAGALAAFTLNELHPQATAAGSPAT
ncbi:MAG: hypothetical protein ABIR58_00615, partial [Gemmatimonadaceae bacterium]